MRSLSLLFGDFGRQIIIVSDCEKYALMRVKLSSFDKTDVTTAFQPRSFYF
jgi:hypothetical protein